jgi:hypothetical protein
MSGTVALGTPEKCLRGVFTELQNRGAALPLVWSCDRAPVILVVQWPEAQLPTDAVLLALLGLISGLGDDSGILLLAWSL